VCVCACVCCVCVFVCIYVCVVYLSLSLFRCLVSVKKDKKEGCVCCPLGAVLDPLARNSLLTYPQLSAPPSSHSTPLFFPCSEYYQLSFT
jgi:hypothetical protein